MSFNAISKSKTKSKQRIVKDYEEEDFKSSTETDDSNEEVFLPSPTGEIHKNPVRKGRAKNTHLNLK